MVVIAISALKDLFEDLKRHRQDKEENQRKVEVLRSEQFVQDKQQTLRVGEIIRLKQNDSVPADILLISSSEKKGICYIETKNLDGETNLKRKQVPEILQKMSSHDIVGGKNNRIVYEPPNPYLYIFKGKLTVRGKDTALDSNNFLLRGCSIRNTESVMGVVCYTGHESKIMLNSVRAKPKQSRVEKEMNNLIIQIFVVQVIICFLTSLTACIWQKQIEGDMNSYLNLTDTEKSFGAQLFIKWGTWILIFTNFVPISLLVTLEMVKFFQGICISKDAKTYSLVGKTPTIVQSSNLNEELGQVQYIFSDKTGTLTCNIMKYDRLSVNGLSLGDERTITDQQLRSYPDVSNVDFRDKRLFDIIANPDDANYAAVYDALLFLALCHTVISEVDQATKKLVYNASSPDELALVNFAKFCGFEYMGTDNSNQIMVKFRSTTLKFELLHVLEFNSTRKRQSIIVRDARDKKIYLLCKGADSVLEKLLDKKVYRRDNPLKIQTWSHLVKYGNVGLRTLLLCKRQIPEEEFKEWDAKYKKACQSIENREELMESAQAEVEVALHLVGATAIQDMLQDQVDECIKQFRDAGIQVWVLTGDKVETAINIAFSCQLLDKDMDQLMVCAQTREQVALDLKTHADTLARVKQEMQDKFDKSKYALIVSGDAMIHCMKDAEMTQLLVTITKYCQVVLACRVSPKQKMEIVQMVRKHNPTVSTLAIGDGANDVNMISAAHVGIGIK